MDIISAVTVLIMFLLDGLWIGANYGRYSKAYEDVQGSVLKVKVSAAIIAYAFIAALLVFVIVPWAATAVPRSGLIYPSLIASFVGLCVYGIYNFTNLALFTRYPWSVAIIDTLWGATLFFMVTYIALSFKFGMKK